MHTDASAPLLPSADHPMVDRRETSPMVNFIRAFFHVIHFLACATAATVTPWLGILFIRFTCEGYASAGLRPPVPEMLATAFIIGISGPLVLYSHFWRDYRRYRETLERQ